MRRLTAADRVALLLVVVFTALALAAGFRTGDSQVDVDERVFRRTLVAMASGEGYYPAMRDALVEKESAPPTQVRSIRPPTLFVLLHRLPVDAWRWAVGVVFLASLVLAWRLGRPFSTFGGPAAVALVGIWMLGASGLTYLHPELWGAPLVLGGALALRDSRWALAALLVAAAAAFRELYLIAFVAGLVVTERRRAWWIAGAALVVAGGLHAWQATHVLADSGKEAPFGASGLGLDYVLSAVSPGRGPAQWIVGIVGGALGVVGLRARWPTDRGARLVLLSAAVLIPATILLGRQYWCLTFGPALACFAPAGVAGLTTRQESNHGARVTATSSTARRIGWGPVILTVGALAAVVLHQLAGHVWPVPWPDEIDFLTPAAQLARHGTLAVPQLRAPDGMFWVPDLYYLLLAPVLRFAPLSVDTGRWVSLAAVIIAAAGFWVAGRRAGAPSGPAALVVTVWLLAPRVTMAGNLARQEAIVLAFVAWSLAASFARRRLLALALAALAALTHPVGVPFALVIALPNLRGGWPSPRRWEWCVAGAVGGVALFQAVHLVSNLDVAVDQIRFQFNRKADRSSEVAAPVVGLVFLLCAVAVDRLRRRAGWQPAVLVGLSLVGVAVVAIGKEQWYEVYGYETAVLLGALAALLLIAGGRDGRAPRMGIVVAAVVAAVLFLPGGYGRPFYAMEFRTHPSEWDEFARRVRVELHRLSATSTDGTTVLVNSLSGLPWPLETDRIGRLHLVKETEVTKASGGYDYVLFTRTLFSNPTEPQPRGTVIAQITSSYERFDTKLIAARNVR